MSESDEVCRSLMSRHVVPACVKKCLLLALFHAPLFASAEDTEGGVRIPSITPAVITSSQLLICGILHDQQA